MTQKTLPPLLKGVKEASQKIVDSGAADHGFAYTAKSWFMESWLARGDSLMTNNGNGRDGESDAMVFDNEVGSEIFNWIDEMISAGLAEDTTPAGDITEGIDHYLAVGNRTSAMTVETSAALSTITELLGSGQFPGVEIGVGFFPGQGDANLPLAGGSNFIVDTGDEEQHAASFAFTEFLLQPENQVEWAIGSGYVPLHQDSLESEQMTNFWDKNPLYKVAYDQLFGNDDPPTNASLGPSIGNYTEVRKAIEQELAQLAAGKADPEEALQAAVESGTKVLTEYNSRVGR